MELYVAGESQFEPEARGASVGFPSSSHRDWDKAPPLANLSFPSLG